MADTDTFYCMTTTVICFSVQHFGEDCFYKFSANLFDHPHFVDLCTQEHFFHRMHKNIERKVGISRPSSALRPPPLFRSIGPPGLSAGLPPHRRLRSLFCRSRAVLPANTHSLEASDTHTFTDIQTGKHARTVLYPLACNDTLSEDIQSCKVLNAFQPDLHRGAVFSSGGFADTSIVLASPQVQSGQLFSPLCPSVRVSGHRGRQGRWVTPLQTSEDPAIKDKQQQQKRRKRSFKVNCAGKQKYAVPSLTEKEEDARLCEWLQSLGIADEKDSNNQQRLFVSRCRGREQESHRRDRRPHFLPPICQSDSLLHVPLLLPENSPPPSPCTYPDPSTRPLPVPLLQPLSSRRK